LSLAGATKGSLGIIATAEFLKKLYGVWEDCLQRRAGCKISTEAAVQSRKIKRFRLFGETK
jgi:hypothetical protein